MKHDFFHSLQDQLEQAGDSGEPPRRRRWRALRRRLRALWRRRAAVAGLLAVGAALAAVLAVAVFDLHVVGGDRPAGASSASAHSVVAGKYASDLTQSKIDQLSKKLASANGASAAGTAAVGGGAFGGGNGSQTQTVAAGTPVSLSFSPRSVTAISEFEWWILGKSRCSGACGSSLANTIVRTTTGGYSFVQIPAPANAQVDGLRFADQSDGYLYGPQLWSTHDGGEHWRRVAIAGRATQLASAGGYAFAIVEGRDGDALWRSPIGTDAWRRLRDAGQAQSLWVQGDSVLVNSQPSSSRVGRLRYSNDSGLTFTAGAKNPDGWDLSVCDYDETLDGTIWATCGNGGQVMVYRSVNGGARFSAAGGAGGGFDLVRPAFAAAGSSVAVVATMVAAGHYSLQRTIDGGRSWSAAVLTGLAAGGTLRRVSYIGFTDATHGMAIVELSLPVKLASGTESSQRSWRLYYTTDAGASYHYVPISG